MIKVLFNKFLKLFRGPDKSIGEIICDSRECGAEKETQESKCNEASYETRIVAFADILGWKAATRASAEDEGELGRLREVVGRIERHARSFTRQTKNQMLAQAPPVLDRAEYEAIEFSFFSDSFAVSALEPHGEKVFGMLSWAVDYLLTAGFLVRGGVAIGKLYHHESMIYGPALVEAVEIEGAAVYPRVLCSKELLKYLRRKQYLNKVVLQDCCQEWVVRVANVGTVDQRDILMRKIQDKLRAIEKAGGPDRIASKWRYMQIMLPMMYKDK